MIKELELERENRELRQPNEILRMASAHFAQAPSRVEGKLLPGNGSSTARSANDCFH